MLTYSRSVTTDSEIGATLYLPSRANGLMRHGYLLLPGNSISNVDNTPATLTLDQTWQPGYPGVYLFFTGLPAGNKDKKGFVTAAAQHLKHSDRKNVRFTWFKDTEKWSTGLAAPQEIEVAVSENKATNPQLYAFYVGQYSLRIAKNNLIYPNDSGNGFIFESRKKNSFGSSKRAKIADKMELVLKEGYHQGCFRFPLNMSAQELGALDISLYYFWNDHQWGIKRLGYPIFEVSAENKTWSFMGVFDPLNPLNETIPRSQRPERFSELRTGFIFSKFDNTGNNSALPTYFRTNFGKQIELLPATINSKGNRDGLQEALLTFNSLDTEKNKFSMVLQGDFHLRVALRSTQSQDSPQHFLCGLSGTETISFKGRSEDYPGDILRFHPLKPAFSPVFPVISTDTQQATGASSPLLSDKLTTSWVSIRTTDQTRQDQENLYYSQPQDAPLFKATVNSGNRLDVFDAPSANLLYSDIKLDCYPLVPVAAAPVMKTSEKEKEHLLQYEFQILNPARKQAIEYFTTRNRPLIAQSAEPKINPANIELTTTPQGFLVGFDKTDASKKWQSLILANDQNSKLPPLELQEPPHYLQSAFQTNEQFLVISNPDRETLDYLKHKFQNQINIAEWPFLFDVARQITNSNTSTRYRNILIFKFCNHSLVERLKNPELWTQANTFNKKSQLHSLAGWILDYIDKSRQQKTQLHADIRTSQNQHEHSIIRQGYEDFLQKVDDPNWNGIMALQVTLELDQLPEAIKSIVAGIDIRRFAAHHVGINSNQILSSNGHLDKDFKSSMFGLISYFDQDYTIKQSQPDQVSEYLPPAPGDYDFKVLELQVLFKNSEISDFNCKIQLSINTLFNEPVIKEDSKANNAINKFSIVLEGLYEKHDGHTSYTFRQLSDNSLCLSSIALYSVRIQGIELSTVNETASAKEETKSDQTDDGKVTTRFALTGQIAMQELEDFDMLSYETISFSSLYIDMEFDINAPQRSKRFNFIPADIVIDTTESSLRNDSLVAHFPITLQSLEHYSPSISSNDSSPEVSPSTLGYQMVEAPINYNSINATWYGLQFNLNLGTMGSLAAKAGFEATLLLTWSPGFTNKAAQMWIKTPFSGGSGKQFSIQGARLPRRRFGNRVVSGIRP